MRLVEPPRSSPPLGLPFLRSKHSAAKDTCIIASLITLDPKPLSILEKGLSGHTADYVTRKGSNDPANVELAMCHVLGLFLSFFCARFLFSTTTQYIGRENQYELHKKVRKEPSRRSRHNGHRHGNHRHNHRLSRRRLTTPRIHHSPNQRILHRSPCCCQNHSLTTRELDGKDDNGLGHRHSSRPNPRLHQNGKRLGA